MTFGSNAAVPQPKGAYETLFAAAGKETGLTVKPNWVDHNTFQQNISTLPAGQPGRRVQLVRRRAHAVLRRRRASPCTIDDVWEKIGANYTDAMKAQSKGKDGNYYLVPFDYYPWAVFYSKSLWQAKGYTAPTDLGRATSRWPRR